MGRREDDETITSINVTPLVDVVLVLLVVLMVATTVTVARHIDLRAASAAPSEPTESPPPLDVRIEEGGAVLVDGERITEVVDALRREGIVRLGIRASRAQ